MSFFSYVTVVLLARRLSVLPLVCLHLLRPRLQGGPSPNHSKSWTPISEDFQLCMASENPQVGWPTQRLVYIDPTHITMDNPNSYLSTGGYCDLYTGWHITVGKVAIKRPRIAGQTYAEREIEVRPATSLSFSRMTHALH